MKLIDHNLEIKLKLERERKLKERVKENFLLVEPKIESIDYYQNLHETVEHWRSKKVWHHDLFTLETRPLAVRNSYVRSHAPGDFRLSCSMISHSGPFGIGVGSFGGSFQNSNRTRKPEDHRESGNSRTISFSSTTDYYRFQSDRESKPKQCHCNCGFCHHSSSYRFENNPENNNETSKRLFGTERNSLKQILKQNYLCNNNGDDDCGEILSEVKNEISRDRNRKQSDNDGVDEITTASTKTPTATSLSSSHSSSSSSVVTWSSITSSNLDPSVQNHHRDPARKNQTEIVTRKHQTQSNERNQTNSSDTMLKCKKLKIQPMSSFSSYGDYSQISTDDTELNPIASKTIDDFFRKNSSLVIDSNNKSSRTQCQCQCQCRKKDSSERSEITYHQVDSKRSNQIESDCNQKIRDGSQSKNETLDKVKHQNDSDLSRQNSSNAMVDQSFDQWYWWWWFSRNDKDRSDDNYENQRRRWSSALTGSSPMKPNMLDELTIWLRENIETRWTSELPNDVLLQRALSPPCSNHTITLDSDERRRRRRRSMATDNDSILDEDKSFKLKRRWSLFPFQRKSLKFFHKNRRLSMNVVDEHQKMTNESKIETIGDMNGEENTQNSSQLDSKRNVDAEENKENVFESVDGSQTPNLSSSSKTKAKTEKPIEIVLMSLKEREKILADQFAGYTMVNIDVSGRKFAQLSDQRRSLIHVIFADFRIPRNKIYIRNVRGRSQSPYAITKSRYVIASDTTPYSSTMVPYDERGRRLLKDQQQKIQSEEKGCQTETIITDEIFRDNQSSQRQEFYESSRSATKLMVPIEVHRNDEIIDEKNDDDEYVVILRRNHHQHHHNSNQQQQSKHSQTIDDTTTSSNASTEFSSRPSKHRTDASVTNSDSMQSNQNRSTRSSGTQISKSFSNKQFRKSLQKVSDYSGGPKSLSGSILQQNHSFLRYRNNENILNRLSMKSRQSVPNKSSKRNGTRSSSGNWSAATSDLVHSSSSSSPPLKLSNVEDDHKHDENDDDDDDDDEDARNQIDTNLKDCSKRLDRMFNLFESNNHTNQDHQAFQLSPLPPPSSSSSPTMGNHFALRQRFFSQTMRHHQNHNNHLHHHNQNEESESVYSVDNDGYYTSMHTDSGLFFGSNSLPLSHHHHHQNSHQISPMINASLRRFMNEKSKNFTTFTSQIHLPSSPSPRKQSKTNAKDNQDDDDSKHPVMKLSRTEPKTDLNKFFHSSKWKRFNSNRNSPFYKHSDLAYCNSNNSSNTSGDNNHLDMKKKNLEEKFGSNSSINSILSNSDAATSTATAPITSSLVINPLSDDLFNDGTTISLSNYDRSVSRCSNRRLNRTQARCSSSETLHTNDYDDEEENDRSNGALHRNSIKNAKQFSSFREYRNPSTSSSMAREKLSRPSSIRFSNLTESSSNSSSYRKLPPPPPPPRVSSMLRTLQQYNSQKENGSFNDRDEISGNGDPHNHGDCHSEQNDLNVDRSITSQSETNSEYFHSNLERHRRLGLEIDSNRSYPPISFINDQTDTATSISVASSACFDDDDVVTDGSLNQSFSTSTNRSIRIHQSRTAMFMLSESTTESIESESKKTSYSNSMQNSEQSDSKTNESSRTITPVFSEKTDTNVQQNDYGRPNVDQLLLNLGSNCQSSIENGSIKKPLEERHLSSPLPTPKLDSFKIEKDGKHHHRHHYYYQRKNYTSNSPSSTLIKSSPQTSTKSKESSQSDSLPKPKPRNSLILSATVTTTETTASETNSDSNTSKDLIKSSIVDDKVILKMRDDKSKSEQQSLEIESSEKFVQKSDQQTSPNRIGRRLTTEDLFIILHNSKKRHNIKPSSQIQSFSSAVTGNKILGDSQSPVSSIPSPLPSPRSPTSPEIKRSIQSPIPFGTSTLVTATKSSSVFTMNNCNSLPLMKRRSWADHSTTAMLENQKTSTLNHPRTRQSLALDRLGPLRPTTLNDFKRLLAQVRQPLNSSNPNAKTLSPTKVTSTYVALQQVLKATSPSTTTTKPSPSLRNYNENEEISNRTETENQTLNTSINEDEQDYTLNQQLQSPQSSKSSGVGSTLCSPLSPTQSSSMTPSTTSSSLSTEIFDEKNQSTSKSIQSPPLSPKSSISSMSWTNCNYRKKFSKSNHHTDSKLSIGRYGLTIGTNFLPMRLDTYPPIPEDESAGSNEDSCSSQKNDQSNDLIENNDDHKQPDLSRNDSNRNQTNENSKEQESTSTWV
ncbi:hypothetical protein QR98_0085390 [Sarcoptes scabiei]|uniref:Uncharacterized protein n=1 Tax=Sarcoptes scabiei TaxID=52283 RepID=A0A132AGD0_SARSC|nr:hypothetical protein QR98_0085390 [Sarcoptes scabiei]